MPVSASVYELREPISLRDVRRRVDGYSFVREEKVEWGSVRAGAWVEGLHSDTGRVWGTFVEVFLQGVEYAGSIIRVPVQREYRFHFMAGEPVRLIIFDSGSRADKVAGIFSEIIFGERGKVIACTLGNDEIRGLFENTEANLKSVVFGDLPLPGVSRATLFGDNLVESEVYRRYVEMGGRIRYAMFRTNGMLLGVSWRCRIVSFTQVEEERLLEYVIENIIA